MFFDGLEVTLLPVLFLVGALGLYCLGFLLDWSFQLQYGTFLQFFHVVSCWTGQQSFAFLSVLADIGRVMQTLMLFDRPNLEALLLAFGQGLLNIPAELYLIIKEIIGLKLLIVIVYFLRFEQEWYVPEAAQLGVLHKDDAHVVAPKTVLQCFVNDDLIKQDLVCRPYFDSIVESASEDELQIRAITHSNDIVLVVDRLTVEHYRRLLPVIYKLGELEQSLLEDYR